MYKKKHHISISADHYDSLITFIDCITRMKNKPCVCSSWHPISLAISLFVDLAPAKSWNPPPVTSSYCSSNSLTIYMIDSDRYLTKSTLFSSSAMILLQTCGNGTSLPSTSLRIGFLFPTRFERVIALIICQFLSIADGVHNILY